MPPYALSQLFACICKSLETSARFSGRDDDDGASRYTIHDASNYAKSHNKYRQPLFAKPKVANQRVPPIMQLPAELLFTIEDYMTADQIICLGLTCHFFWSTFSITRGLRYLRFDKAQDGCKSNFLSAFEPSLPGFWPCHTCLKFHPRDSLEVPGDEFELQRRRKQLTDLEWSDELRRRSLTHHYSWALTTTCEKINGYFYIQNTPIRWEFCRLVVRAQTLSSKHGIPLNRLEYHWNEQDKDRYILMTAPDKLDDFFFPENIDILPQVVQGRLILRAEHTLRVYPSSFEQVKDPGRHLFWTCSHQTFEEGSMLSSFFLEAVAAGRRSASRFGAGKSRRCCFCLTEFNIKLRTTSSVRRGSFVLAVNVYRDFGLMKHPSDPEWRSQEHEPLANDKIGWRRSPYLTKSLGDVYEARSLETKIYSSSDFVYAKNRTRVKSIIVKL